MGKTLRNIVLSGMLACASLGSLESFSAQSNSYSSGANYQNDGKMYKNEKRERDESDIGVLFATSVAFGVVLLLSVLGVSYVVRKIKKMD